MVHSKLDTRFLRNLNEDQKRFLLINFSKFFQKDFIMGQDLKKYTRKIISVYKGNHPLTMCLWNFQDFLLWNQHNNKNRLLEIQNHKFSGNVRFGSFGRIAYKKFF